MKLKAANLLLVVVLVALAACSKPLAERDLSQIALQASDLSGQDLTSHVQTNPKLTWSELGDGLTTQYNVMHSEEGSGSSILTEIYVYSDVAHAGQAVAFFAGKLPGEAVEAAAIGDESHVIRDTNYMLGVNVVAIVWRHKEAVVRLMQFRPVDQEVVVDTLVQLAKTVESRLSK